MHPNRPLRLCPTCSRFDGPRFLALKTCPTCDGDLAQRVADREKLRFRRSPSHIAHPLELTYGSTPILETGAPIRHEKSDLIGYAHGLVQATSTVMAWARADDFGIGFLTGSAPLMWLLRELYPNRLAERIRYVPGLAHTHQDAETSLRRELNNGLANGMRRLFVVDEVISGTQLRTNALAIERWADDFHSTRQLDVLFIGLKPARAKKSVREIARLVRSAKRHNRPMRCDFDVRLIAVPELLASDNEGRLIKGIRKAKRQPGYFNSRWRTDGYIVACRTEVETGCARHEVLATAGSMDQVFASTIRRMLKPTQSKATAWPDLTMCRDCRMALDALRDLVAALPDDVPQDVKNLGTISEVRRHAAYTPLVVVPRNWRQ